ncbi:DEKNAAC100715 [Brettanomyces naardenensis]|uniref:DEKNAAC100715 n=1 Tax=Brettanomyces naardenensis TaxID=13370 RepID=A0A448YG45_BRENA|nr:DEKNAAC100715 [Brettanomyces naardenensis]
MRASSPFVVGSNSYTIHPDYRGAIKKFLHITSLSNTLKGLAAEIQQRFLRIYPDEKPLQIVKIQDVDECDLDPDYTVSMIFDVSNVVRVLVADELQTEGEPFIHGKRRLDGDLNKVMRKIRRQPQIQVPNISSIWDDVETEATTIKKPAAAIAKKTTKNASKKETLSGKQILPGPDATLDHTIVVEPKKASNMKVASPIVAKGSPKRITSGMLSAASQPNLSKNSDAEDSTYEQIEENDEGYHSASTSATLEATPNKKKRRASVPAKADVIRNKVKPGEDGEVSRTIEEIEAPVKVVSAKAKPRKNVAKKVSNKKPLTEDKVDSKKIEDEKKTPKTTKKVAEKALEVQTKKKPLKALAKKAKKTDEQMDSSSLSTAKSATDAVSELTAALANGLPVIAFPTVGLPTAPPASLQFEPQARSQISPQPLPTQTAENFVSEKKPGSAEGVEEPSIDIEKTKPKKPTKPRKPRDAKSAETKAKAPRVRKPRMTKKEKEAAEKAATELAGKSAVEIAEENVPLTSVSAAVVSGVVAPALSDASLVAATPSKKRAYKKKADRTTAVAEVSGVMTTASGTIPPDTLSASPTVPKKRTYKKRATKTAETADSSATGTTVSTADSSSVTSQAPKKRTYKKRAKAPAVEAGDASTSTEKPNEVSSKVSQKRGVKEPTDEPAPKRKRTSKKDALAKLAPTDAPTMIASSVSAGTTTVSVIAPSASTSLGAVKKGKGVPEASEMSVPASENPKSGDTKSVPEAAASIEAGTTKKKAATPRKKSAKIKVVEEPNGSLSQNTATGSAKSLHGNEAKGLPTNGNTSKQQVIDLLNAEIKRPGSLSPKAVREDEVSPDIDTSNIIKGARRRSSPHESANVEPGSALRNVIVSSPAVMSSSSESESELGESESELDDGEEETTFSKRLRVVKTPKGSAAKAKVVASNTPTRKKVPQPKTATTEKKSMTVRKTAATPTIRSTTSSLPKLSQLMERGLPNVRESSAGSQSSSAPTRDTGLLSKLESESDSDDTDSESESDSALDSSVDSGSDEVDSGSFIDAKAASHIIKKGKSKKRNSGFMALLSDARRAGNR